MEISYSNSGLKTRRQPKMLTGKAVPAKVFTSTVGENPFHLPLSTGMFCPLNSKALDVPSILIFMSPDPK